MYRTTYDAIAFNQLRTTGQIKRSLIRESAAAVGEECPECGGRVTEDNGGTEYRCCNCDHRWGFEYGARYGF